MSKTKTLIGVILLNLILLALTFLTGSDTTGEVASGVNNL
jgi:hypothetical protein